MVVEHIFVTTHEAPQVVALASDLLVRHGFEPIANRAFAMSPDIPTSVQFQRKGKRRAFRLTAASILDAAQHVRLDFDRGRVTVAASLENPATQISDKSLFRRKRPITALQTEWLLALANALDARLAQHLGVEESERPLLAAKAAADAFRRKQRIRVLVVVAVIVFAFAALITTVVLSSQRR